MGALCIGKGLVTGGDFRLKYQPKTEALTSLLLRTMLSWLNTEEKVFNQLGVLEWRDVGDLANDTLQGGACITFNDHWQINLRGRYYDLRQTIETNKLDEVDRFISIDANLTY